MTVEKKLYEALKIWPPLTRLIDGRLYPVRIPQGEKLPVVVYSRVSGAPYNCLGSDYRTVRVRIRLDVWAATYDEAHSIADALASGIASAEGFEKIIENIGLDWGDDKTYRTSIDVICWEKGGYDYE